MVIMSGGCEIDILGGTVNAHFRVRDERHRERRLIMSGGCAIDVLGSTVNVHCCDERHRE